MPICFVGKHKRYTFAVYYFTITLFKVMIKVSDITFGYNKFSENVLQNFSLHLEKNKIYGLLGKNGTGKSTLLYLIAGLLTPQNGHVEMNGTNTAKRGVNTLSEIYLVPEEFNLPDVSLREYVRLNAPFYPNFDQALLNCCLSEFELPQDVHLGRLSMGQRKKAFICFALATNTRLLLMDEPTNGLDIPSKRQFRRVVSQCMNEERTIVISTHQVRDVDTLIDHIVMLHGKSLLLDASTADVCRAISFGQSHTADAPHTLYAEPTLSGYAVVSRNIEEEDSPLNQELLFNALQENPEVCTIIEEAQQKAKRTTDENENA